jgi:hypothetical protein
MHHPHLNNTHAPDYMQVKEVCPRMKPHLVPGEQLESLMSYFMDFADWESQLRLYHEAKDLRDSKLHLLFIRGPAEVLRLHVTPEEGDLLSSARSIAVVNMSLQPTRICMHMQFMTGFMLSLVHLIRKSKLLQPKAMKNTNMAKKWPINIDLHSCRSGGMS